MVYTGVTSEVENELGTIALRLGNSPVVFAPGNVTERQTRIAQLLKDLACIDELLSPRSLTPKAIGPISVSGNFVDNIINALKAWWSADDIAAFNATLSKRINEIRSVTNNPDIQLEAIDVIECEEFSEICIKHIDHSPYLIFEIPDSEHIQASAQLCAFMREFNNGPQAMSVYVFGSSDNLLWLLSRISTMGETNREAALLK